MVFGSFFCTFTLDDYIQEKINQRRKKKFELKTIVERLTKEKRLKAKLLNFYLSASKPPSSISQILLLLMSSFNL